jgi:hypothetical protein
MRLWIKYARARSWPAGLCRSWRETIQAVRYGSVEIQAVAWGCHRTMTVWDIGRRIATQVALVTAAEGPSGVRMVQKVTWMC